MAKRISPDVKKAILREFSRPGSTKAGIARKHEISVSTVNRIIAASKDAVKPGEHDKSKPDGHEIVSLLGMVGVKESDLRGLLSALKEKSGSASPEDLFKDFMGWIENRDEMEKERLLISNEIESLKSRRELIGKEITDLEAKTASLEINIWRMKSSADRAHDSMSRVEERMDALEDRMIGNREILFLAAGLKSLLETGYVSENTLSYIANPKDTWGKDNQAAVGRIREILMEYLQKTGSRFPSEG